MITVKFLIERLSGLDPNDKVYVYEGERTGIVIISAKSLRFKQFIRASEIEEDEEE